MSTRTDIHRPTEMDPADYEYVATGYNHIDGMPGWVATMGDYGLQLSRWIAATDRLDRGTFQCHHCGARMNYFAILRHLPTGDAVVVGETCLDNRFELESKAEFTRLRKTAQLGREQQRIKTAARECLASLEHRSVAAILERDVDLAAVGFSGSGAEFVADVRRKLWKYGSISPNQAAAVGRVLAQAIAPIRPPEPEPTMVDAPSGRVTIQGKAVHFKEQYSDYGVTVKMMVIVTVDGGQWKGWVSVPSSISEVERGDTVELTAAWTPSNDDASFAFGSRPTKASILTKAERR